MAKQTASARRAAKTAKAQAKKAEAKTKRAARAQAKAEKEAKAKALATTKATEIDKLLAQLKSVVDNACERFETDMHDAAQLAFRLQDEFGLTQFKIGAAIGRTQQWVSAGAIAWSAHRPSAANPQVCGRARLVLKELADNALDAGAAINGGRIKDHRFFIEDDGPGLDGTPEQIAELLSIRRPMRSSKLLRLPQRGALGNGLRVVAGAVLASEGSLTVITRNRRIELCPQANGSTAVVKVTEADRPVGTRIEIGFGAALPDDSDPFAWARKAQMMACAGKSYGGRTSPYWYDAAQFHELLLAYGSQPVRSLIAQFDGCTGGKAGEIVAAAGLDRMACADINRQQAARLLETARLQVRPVSPDRLGHVGRDAFRDCQYAMQHGTAVMGSSKPQAEIPFVVEAWAEKEVAGDDVDITAFINRTPSVDEVIAFRSRDKNLCLRGSGLNHYTEDAPKKGAYDIKVNITTAYCPITSDGKAPNLEPFAAKIMTAIAMAMRKAQRAAPKDKKLSQKDVVLDHLDTAIAAASGHGEYRFNERQIFYQLRPIVLEETGQELLIGNFKRILTDYENEHGEIDGMYREPRGSIYHPHRGNTIPLGTLTVEEYERPLWTFNKLGLCREGGLLRGAERQRLAGAARLCANVIQGFYDTGRPRSGR